MDKRVFDTGMYIIDKNYCILNCNEAMKDMYPEVKEGDICYKALAMSEQPCATCPLVHNDVLFFNPVRKEWISANAAKMEYPGHGECYNVQFKMRKNIGGTKREIIRMEKLDEYLADLKSDDGTECVIGAYREQGAPLFLANENMWKLLGYEDLDDMVEGIDGLALNIIHPEDRSRIAEDLVNCTKPGDAFESILRISNKIGTWIWVVMRGKIIETSSGKMASLAVCSNMESFLALHGVLEEKHEELRQKEELNEVLMSQIPGGYHCCAVDEKYTFLYISKSFEETIGWTKEEIRDNFDNKFINLVCPEDIGLFYGLVDDIDKKGNASTVYRLKRKDGGYRWVQDSTMIVQNDKRSYYQCTLADISEFVEQQEKLAKRNNELHQKKLEFETIVNNIPSGFHRCAAKEGCPFIYIGDHFQEIVGFTKEEIATEFDNKYNNLIWPEDTEAMDIYEQMLQKKGEGNVYDTRVYRVRHKDGGYRWVTDSTMFVDLEEESFFQGTIADITPYIEELEKSRDRAQASSNAKSTFLFNASHDIRTPMNAIQGFAHIIECNQDNEQIVSDAIRKIQQASETLMTLMNDVLELSRIEQGKEEVNYQEVDLFENGKNLYEMFVGEMQEAGIQFSVSGDRLDDHVYCDSLKLTRIMMNLLSNAKKFTPAGGSVSFGGQRLRIDENTATYRFFVKDTGIGMSKEFQEKAFEQFERERTSTESGMTGSGLGLAITKRLVDLMGGQIIIESELAKGTEISAILTFELVREKDLQKNTGYIQLADMTGKRVLLVEDNEFNREIARFVLEDMGILVDEVENGSLAVDKVLKAEAGYYDLVLMDIQMPVMDGYTATCEIRNIPDSESANVPIIAMTANAFVEDRERCLEVGMDEHISKPIDATMLAKTMSVVFEKRNMK